MQRYLVVGLAKTGTTVISKTVQNSAGIADYMLEPKTAAALETLAEHDGDVVVKILFDHWFERPNLLEALVSNELGTRFDHVICLTRDPRAELVSRLHYMAFSYFLRNDYREGDEERWLRIFREKEAAPAAVPLQRMFSYLSEEFGVFGDGTMAAAGQLSRIYGQFLRDHPAFARDVVRYEDFFAGTVDTHPLAHLLAGSRNTGRTLDRTRRSGGEDDWTAFLCEEDGPWLEGIYAESLDLLGYDRALPDRAGAIDPEKSSRYVERIIREGRYRRNQRLIADRGPTGRAMGTLRGLAARVRRALSGGV